MSKTMSKIILISCCKHKRKDKGLVKDMYYGKIYDKTYEYAKLLKPDYLYILSAKYGLLKEDDIIEDYDMTLSKQPLDYRKEWSKKIIQSLKDKGHNLENDEFLILAGTRYHQYLTPHLKNYQTPLAHIKGIGVQIKTLKKKINELKNDVLHK